MDVPSENEYAIKLCLSVEKILTFGLKSMRPGFENFVNHLYFAEVVFFGQTLPYDYIQNLPKCLPHSPKIVEQSKQLGKTVVGRGRVFIRLALNEGSLAEYVNALMWNKPLTT